MPFSTIIKKKYIKEQVSENKFFNPSEDQVGGVYAGGVKIQKQLADLYNLGYNKKISVKDYQGEYVGEKIVSDEAAEAGKKAFYLTLAHEAGILPGEASSISRMILKKAKATAEKPNIKKVADDFKKDLGLKELTQYQKDMIKNGTSLDNMIKNEYEITLYGGLNTPAKQESFKKITDVFGKNIDLKTVVLDINSGLDTKKIINNLKPILTRFNKTKEKWLLYNLIIKLKLLSRHKISSKIYLKLMRVKFLNLSHRQHKKKHRKYNEKLKNHNL